MPVLAFWLGLSAELRCFVVAGLGLSGGALANWMIYRFAYFNPRPISPWGPRPEGAQPRTFLDRLPVIGWFLLRREVKWHGSGFWFRPLLIEIGTAVALVSLFRFETQTGGLLPLFLRSSPFLELFEPYANQIFFTHAILFVLMVAATFIDFDERIIPDVITIPGTLIALVLAASFTNWNGEPIGGMSFMPMITPQLDRELMFPTAFVPTTFEAPWFDQNPIWYGQPGLIWGLGIWTVWCFALTDRRWSGVIVRRRGFGRALQHFRNGLFHHPFWKVLAGIWIVGLGLLAAVWTVGGSHWEGLLTALIGLAVGGGVVWSIRIVATWALRIEAMGFGDVTLMAMIGAFVGWQAALIAFFLSPFAAIAIVVIRYIFTRDTYTPFGPYLCAGTMLSIFFWDRIFNYWLAGNLLLMGSTLLWLCVAMLGLMAFMLFIWRLIKTMFLQR